MPTTPNRPLARVLKASILFALLAAIVVIVVTLAPRSAHPPQPTTDPTADLAAAVETAQLAAWYEWASNLPVEQPAPRPRRRAPVEGNLGAQQAQADGGVWDRIAACESGGNWSTNTGNGYYGGLQMNMSFWHSYGGDEFATRPDLASREEQIVVAERARDSGRGYRPWPVCGRRA